MHSVYILYIKMLHRHDVGESADPERRLAFHQMVFRKDVDTATEARAR
jgi:hypothetical protein